MLILFILALLDVVASSYDIKKTLEGEAKGVGIEKNEVIDKIAHTDKPAAAILILYNLGKIMLILSLGWAFHGMYGYWIAAPFLLVDAAKHYLAAREWQKLIDGGSLKVPTTAWQKFLLNF